jgi:bis(5'-nucleosyl)-tetraphosphatase (symmetrical)
MSTYAVGDIQGCFTELLQLLELIQFNPTTDYLWCTGDLVNRGPNSLETLRFFKQLGERATVVLGNHDLHLLAVAEGYTKYHDPNEDTITDILQAADCQELLTWLRHRPFLHHDAQLNFTMIHAGLAPQWDFALASQCAHEVETALRSENFNAYLGKMYGDKPKKWSKKLSSWGRLRFITNCFTRLRYCNLNGKLALDKKGSPDKNKGEEVPWFQHPERSSRDMRIIFGHWSTLGYYAKSGIYALDSGCLWGGALTALRLEDEQVFCVKCKGEAVPAKAG